MKKTVLFLAVLTVAASCKQGSIIENDQIKKADWLVGNWESKSEFGTLIESWKKLNDSIYVGTSYFIGPTKDTIHSEAIILEQSEEGLTYKATVKGQNDDKTVAFPLTNSSENNLVFENPKHNYPQKIIYTKKSATLLVAEISGIQQGKESKEQYEMTKK